MTCAIKPKQIPSLTEKQITRFWSKVDIQSPEECWPWLGATTRGINGGSRYGAWHLAGGVTVRPHRVAYTLLVGEIPEGLTIDHVQTRGCTTALCCNPAHMEPVTQSENSKRHYDFKGTPTHCKNGHPRERGKRCAGCNVMNTKLYAERHPEKWREIRNNQKRAERARKKQEQIRRAS